MKPGPKPKPLATRFWPKVDMSGGANACWPWTGSLLPNGYGAIQAGGDGTNKPPLKAHRVAWALSNGVDPVTMPTSLVVRHVKCRNKPCCNPDHLTNGTTQDNNHDAIADGTAHFLNTLRDPQGRFT